MRVPLRVPRELSLAMREAEISVRLTRSDQHDLVVRKIGNLDFGLYAAPAYLERQDQPDYAAGCSGHHLITQLDDIQDAAQTSWLADLAPRARVAVQTNSHEAAVLAAMHGGGGSGLPHAPGGSDQDGSPHGRAYGAC